jgi:hypothetical protein
MQNINNVRELKDTIRLLEEEQAIHGQILKEQFYNVIDNIRPVNILKSTFHEVASTPDLLGNLLSATVGLTAGYISNKTLVGRSANLFRKLFGTILQFGVTTLIVKNPDTVKSLGQSIIHRFLNKKRIES